MKKVLGYTVAAVALVLLGICSFIQYTYYFESSHGTLVCIILGIAMLASIVSLIAASVKQGYFEITHRMGRVVGITALTLIAYNIAKSVIYTAVTTHLNAVSVDIFDTLFYNGGIDIFYFVSNISDMVTINAKEQLLMRSPVLIYSESLFEMFAIYSLMGELVDENKSLKSVFKVVMLDKLGFIPVVLFVMRVIVIAANFSSSALLDGITMVYPMIFAISLIAELLEYSPIALINIIPLCMIRDAITNTCYPIIENDTVSVILVLLFALMTYVFWSYWISSAIDDYCDENEGSVIERILSFSLENVTNVIMMVIGKIVDLIMHFCLEISGQEDLVGSIEKDINELDELKQYTNALEQELKQLEQRR